MVVGVMVAVVVVAVVVVTLVGRALWLFTEMYLILSIIHIQKCLN